MEDYKEKYKKALERARNIRFGNPQSATANTVCEEIFPELKESEDEKIRKDIIRVFTGEIGFTTKEEAKKYIAWLEKQGHEGKKWVYEDVYLKEKEQVFQDGVDEVLENPQKYGLEKQGEQNPPWSEEDEKFLNLSLVNLTELKDRFGEKYGKVGDCIDWLKSLKERMKGE